MANGFVGVVKVSGTRSSPLLPQTALDAALWALGFVADGLIALGVTANAVTVSSVMLAAVGGVLLAFGQFGYAAVAMVTASLGDALDGMIARRTGASSVSGALLDASVDRYEELFFLGGLAVYFHDSVAPLLLTLGALGGSYMVSYGSAKAEAIGVPVPAGSMRRAERAICLCAGVILTPLWSMVATPSTLPSWAADAPMLLMLAVVAVGANVSAIRRLRLLARYGTLRARLMASEPGDLESDDGERASDPDHPAAQVVVAPHAP